MDSALIHEPPRPGRLRRHQQRDSPLNSGLFREIDYVRAPREEKLSSHHAQVHIVSEGTIKESYSSVLHRSSEEEDSTWLDPEEQDYMFYSRLSMTMNAHFKFPENESDQDLPAKVSKLTRGAISPQTKPRRPTKYRCFPADEPYDRRGTLIDSYRLPQQSYLEEKKSSPGRGAGESKLPMPSRRALTPSKSIKLASPATISANCRPVTPVHSANTSLSSEFSTCLTPLTKTPSPSPSSSLTMSSSSSTLAAITSPSIKHLSPEFLSSRKSSYTREMGISSPTPSEFFDDNDIRFIEPRLPPTPPCQRGSLRSEVAETASVRSAVSPPGIISTNPFALKPIRKLSHPTLPLTPSNSSTPIESPTATTPTERSAFEWNDDDEFKNVKKKMSFARLRSASRTGNSKPSKLDAVTSINPEVPTSHVRTLTSKRPRQGSSSSSVTPAPAPKKGGNCFQKALRVLSCGSTEPPL